MRMSCNGCRVLRKGCSDNCSIRPCLQWIKSPESQANATVFLAKFYGRAGLMNLINAGPEHLRPGIFRSLLYEACGRIVNPIYGSVGLLWSGSWSLCQTAVEAVLKGAPIVQIASEAAECSNGPPLKAYDIRHVSKEDNSNDLHRVRTRCRFKRSAGRPKANRNCVGSADESCRDELNRSPSHESSLSHQSVAAPNVEGERRETESLASEETAEASLRYGVEPESVTKPSDEADDGKIELELTLGFEPASSGHNVNPKKKRTNDTSYSSDDDGDCKMELGLHYRDSPRN